MAILTETRSRTVCDHCERLCGKGSGRAVLTNTGVQLVPSVQFLTLSHEDAEGPQVTVSLDLCKACVESLYKWWKRGKADEAEANAKELHGSLRKAAKP